MHRYLGVLIGLVIGGALGFGFGVATDPGAGGETARLERELARLRAERAEPAPGRDTESATPAREADTDLDPESRSELGSVLEEIPTPSVDPGTGIIEGTVTLVDGSPLAGVLVEARPHGTPEGWARKHPHDSAIEDYVVESVRYYQWARDLHRTTETAQNGAFVISEVPEDLEYRLNLDLEGYDFERVEGGYNVEPGDTVSYRARETGTIAVTVKRPDGSVPEKAAVSIQHSNRTKTEDWTPDDQTLERPYGTYRVSAAIGREFASTTETVTLGRDTPSATVELRLEPRNGIHGTVTFPQGSELDDVRILWTRALPGQEPDPKLIGQSNQSAWVHRRSPEYSILDIEPGTYHLGLSRRHGREPEVFEVVEVAGGIVEVDFEVPPIDRSDATVVWVRDHEGNPIENVHFSIRTRQGRSSSTNSVDRERRGDGAYWVSPTEDQLAILRGEADGTCTLEVNAANHGTRSLPLEGEGGEIEVRFRASATLAVTVIGFAERDPGTTATVALGPSRDDARVVSITDTTGTSKPVAADGRVLLGPLESGDYELSLRVGGDNRWSSNEVASAPVTLTPGENATTIALPTLYSLTVVVEGEGSGTRLQMQPQGERMSTASAELNAEGEATFSGLAAGTYRLTKWGGGGLEMMTVELPGPSRVAFDPEPVNALAVSVTDPDGKLAANGFEDGDLIVAVEGEEFENLAQMQILFAALMGRDEAKLTVERGGRTVEVTFHPKDLMGGADTGGNIEPTSR